MLRRQRSYEKLKTAMEENGFDQKLYLAAEVYYFQGIGSAGMIPKLCVEGTQTLLLEMPFAQWNSAIYADVEKLVRHQKLKVVLAHIERYYEFQKKKRNLGCRHGTFVIQADECRRISELEKEA